MDWKLPLKSLQKDFIERLKSGNIFHCPIEGTFAELTIILQEETQEIQTFSQGMVNKFKKIPSQQSTSKIFRNNMKGKLAEAAVKARLAHLITPINLDIKVGGDGKVDFQLVGNPNIGIQVKARHGSVDTVQWKISAEEAEKNAALVCILIQEEVTEIQSEYRLIHAGFIPTNQIQVEPGGEASVGIKDLLYCGGLACYLTEICPEDKSVIVPPFASTKGEAILQLEQQLSELDQERSKIGFEIPPGPQRIRGIAGSGKTLLLCQKAAQMYIRSKRENLNWNIALVFFTRSLYGVVTELVDSWLRVLSNDEIRYDPNNPHLRILPAWGQTGQPGFYSTIAQSHGVGKIIPGSISQYSPPERLAYLCKRVLENHSVTPMFDAILIDEWQDLSVNDDELRYQERQAIYWLAWQSLKPSDPQQPHWRRLIWAYDEAQSLHTSSVPTAQEVLGEELKLLIGGAGGGRYPGGIQKAHVMSCCYRTPGWVLTAAHAIGMGWLRPGGMLTGFTSKDDWKDIGYEVKEGDFRKIGSTITLHRPPKNSSNPINTLWKGELLEFETYENRAAELSALANKIQYDLNHEGLKPSQDILVIVLASHFGAKALETQVAQTWVAQGIDIFIPGALQCNILNPTFPQFNANNFWCRGAVTVSGVHRAKGNEASMVYVVGFDNIAQEESNIALRNQLFVALTRSRAWVYLSGVKQHGEGADYPLYEEMRQVIASASRETFTFQFQRPQHDVAVLNPT